MDYEKFQRTAEELLHKIKHKKILTDVLDCYDRIVIDLDDQERNLKRWIHDQPCVFVHPQNRRRIYVLIARDTKAIYEYLMFCYQIKHQTEDEPICYERLIALVNR